jgi:hypothetical protein
MQALTYWKTVTVDTTGFLESLLELFASHQIQFCLIDGQAVNAFVDPVVSLDLDLAIITSQLDEAERLLENRFQLRRFPHSLNVYQSGSDLRVQIQTDPRYTDFPLRATPQEVLGSILPVAAVEDVLQGKVWAASDEKRRGSKRQKDLADISRLIEAYPHLRSLVPDSLLRRLF